MPRSSGRQACRTSAANRRVEHAGGVCSPERTARSGFPLARSIIYLAVGLLADGLEWGCVLAATVEIDALDKATGRIAPARIHLKDSAGNPVRGDVAPFFRDHFTCAGKVRLDLPQGSYSFEIERGPEFSSAKGGITVEEGTNKIGIVELDRLADMAAEGWWSGDLHVHRQLREIELLMQAEDLHVAPVITWWNSRNEWTNQALPKHPLVRFDHSRFYHALAGEDERQGGALLYFNLSQPLNIAGAGREYPSPMKFLAEARQHDGVWVDIEKPFWWDLPIWLASGQCDSIGLANNHMCRDQMYESEAWGRPRDTQRLPPPRGNGFWTQEIYYHVLNCGLRIPPSAGSASGVLPNPVGYNRVYVHCGKRLTWEKWWEGLRAGRSFVSNGPLLRCKANGKLPGHIFKAAERKSVRVEIKALLTSRDPISKIEIIKDGRVERSVTLDQWQRAENRSRVAPAGIGMGAPRGEPRSSRRKEAHSSRRLVNTAGSFGEVTFEESGWFLVRVITDVSKTFRFASTAPYYVEIGETKHRVSKRSAHFFLDWVRERMQRAKVDNPVQREEVLQHHRQAQKFWEAVLAGANVE